MGLRIFTPSGVAILSVALAFVGCGSDGTSTPSAPPTPPPNYDGTWRATLDAGAGSFTMTIAGNTVTAVTYSFSISASSGGNFCSTSVTCPAGAPCASPTVPAPITGGSFTVARAPNYTINGSFGSLTSASGAATHSITSTAALCNVTRTVNWTAVKQ